MSRLKRPSSSSISEILRSKITGGEFLPGEKMPTIRELASKFHVSSDTTYRAYKELQASGLLIMNHGSYTTVANPLPGGAEILHSLTANGPLNEYEYLSESSNIRSLATNVPDLKFF